MPKIQGYVNSAKLALANIGLAGNKLEELIAALNPDAAIAVGHDEREEQLQVAALKLAEQRKRQGQLEVFLTSIAASLTVQKKAAALVSARLQDSTQPQPTDKSKQKLIDTINQLKQEEERSEAELASVKNAVEFLDNLVEARAEALRNFDSEANTVRHRKEMANLRESQAKLETELQDLAQEGTSTAGLAGLTRAAEKAEVRADAAEIVSKATSSTPSSDPVMAAILAEAADSPKQSLNEQLAALAQ